MNRQIAFVVSKKKNGIVGLVLGLFLAALIIFLEPFDTNDYESKYRLLLLFGFGVVFSCSYIAYGFLERIFYSKTKERWLLWHEIVSLLIFFLFAGSMVFLYNRTVINNASYSIEAHLWYLVHIVGAMIPIVFPVLFYLRQRFGEKVLPIAPDSLVLNGLNQNESILIKRRQLLFVRSAENYVEIVYLGSDGIRKSKTFRQSLANIQKQAPFLVKSHRSFLVNIENVESIKGNSQKSQIIIKHIDAEIPLSKSSYKMMKDKLG